MLQTMQIKTDGTVTTVRPSGKFFKLEEMQHAVNGLIEPIYLPIHKAYMIVNEDGKIYNLPINAIATHIFQAVHGKVDKILGDVLIVQESEIN